MILTFTARQQYKNFVRYKVLNICPVLKRQYTNLVENISYIAPVIFLTGYGIYSAFKYIYKTNTYKTQETQTEPYMPVSDGNNLLVSNPNTEVKYLTKSLQGLQKKYSDLLHNTQEPTQAPSQALNNPEDEYYTSVFEPIINTSLPLCLCLTLCINLAFSIKISRQLLISYTYILKHCFSIIKIC